MIITDLGGVLINFDGDALCRNIQSFCGADPAAVRDFLSAESRSGLERGQLSPWQFFEEAVKTVGFGGSFEEFLREFSNPALFSLNSAVADLYFRELKPRNNVDFWVLSNVSVVHYEHIGRLWPGVFSNCRRIFLSFELGLLKPDPAIYKKVLELGGRSNDRYLFIDDLEENVEAARRCGLGATRFESAEKLRSTLAHDGFVLGA